jgi:heat shock protein HtpX
MYSEIAANKRKTYIIMTLFIGILSGLAYLISSMYGNGSPSVLIGVLIGAGLYTAISYLGASRVALAVNGARQITKRDNPRLYNVVENLAITNGMPMPKVYVMDDPSPNAFATGRNPDNAAVCATTGLLVMMTDTELQGVMAHEMGHVKNYDIRVSMIAFALVAAIGLVADMMFRIGWFRDNDDDSNASGALMIVGLIAAILAPFAAMLVQMALSRKRELLADATGALTTRYPEGLASALEKIGTYGTPLRKQNTSTAHLFFTNPLKTSTIANLFSTHPPIEQRIAKLRGMNKA